MIRAIRVIRATRVTRVKEDVYLFVYQVETCLNTFFVFFGTYLQCEHLRDTSMLGLCGL